jgi:acetyltransferase-like isoleucine patch superfamily enzyme
MGVKFFSPWKLSVGLGSNIQGGCFLDCRGGINIGNNVDITLGVKILTEDHDVRSSDYKTRSRSVNLSNGCVIGSFSLILPGIVMSENSVLGAGSVLTKSISEGLIYGGSPAKEIGVRGISFDYICSYKRPFH